MLRISRREVLVRTLLSSGVGTLSGCGTLMYPERRGQPQGELDWGVVLLDGLGLLLFLVPGIIAFVVDFRTGAIYLPPGSHDGYSGRGNPSETDFTELQLPKDELSDDRIAAAVSEHLGQPVDLSEGRCHRRPLRSLTQFWKARERLTAELNRRESNSAQVLRAQSR